MLYAGRAERATGTASVVLTPGIVDYYKALQLQKELQEKVISGSLPGALIVCRHVPVITLGRSASDANLMAEAELLLEKGIGACRTDRGGDVTYHGPGQLVAYPIFNLEHLHKDLHWFLRQLEEVAIRFLAGCGVTGERKAGFTGVWVGTHKIASVGISVRQWVTMHGLSINIRRDIPDGFSLIRPCGLDVRMAYVQDFFGSFMDVEAFTGQLVKQFGKVFGLEFREEAGTHD